MKIMIIGASGTGKTSLGKEVAEVIGYTHLDSDDYYWKKTSPPYQEKVALTLRNDNIKKDFFKNENVVLSGCMPSWGEEWREVFDLVVFIQLEHEERIKRLLKREKERYGEKLESDEYIIQNSKGFLNWARQYDNPYFTGKTLAYHVHWLKHLQSEVLHVDGKTEFSVNVDIIVNEIRKLNT
ncbi:conserved hypothetical protein [Tenacibaculum sp. 190524A05c]|uniref:AAA family ATPase n=1 Tax=Tenacibaculum platacis TaxID=3137852 RepID=UPI0031FA833C